MMVEKNEKKLKSTKDQLCTKTSIHYSSSLFVMDKRMLFRKVCMTILFLHMQVCTS